METEETTVTVETESPAEETPEVVDTGDTIVVTAPDPEPANDDTDRWIGITQRIDALTNTVESLAAAMAATAATAAAAEETAEIAEETVTAAIEAETFEEDEIIPEQSHAWFRPLDEWRGR